MRRNGLRAALNAVSITTVTMNITLVDSQAALRQKMGSNIMVRRPAY